MQVHDELVIDAAKDEVDKVKDILKTEMENAVKLSVPLDVDISVGNNWMECKRVSVFVKLFFRAAVSADERAERGAV